MFGKRPLEGGINGKTAQQMPEHVGIAYKEAVDNIIFVKRQQWMALGSLLQSHWPCTKLAWRTYNRCLCDPLVYLAPVSTRDREA
jgi:hypothetical protein